MSENDLIEIEFVDWDKRRGIRPADVVSIGNALGAALAAFAPPGAADSPEMMLVEVVPGSLKLLFRAAARKLQSDPVAQIASWAALIVASKHLVAALISVGFASPLPPNEAEADIPALSSEQRKSCVVFHGSVTMLEGQIIIRVPGYMPVDINRRLLEVRFDSQHPSWPSSPQAYRGQVDVLARPSLAIKVQPNKVLYGFIGAISGPTSGKVPVLVLWDVPSSLPSTNLDEFLVQGRLYNVIDATRELDLVNDDQRFRSRIRADAVLVVSAGGPSERRGTGSKQP